MCQQAQTGAAPCRVLITGCSGAGKSMLLSALAGRGHATVPEPGRRVIAAERATGGTGFPWTDPLRFARLCFALATADWAAAGPGVTFFDRGVFDAAVNLDGLGAPDPDALTGYPYDRVVLAPPWPEIFVADPERRHDHGAAVEEFRRLEAAVADLRIAPLVLPRAPVADRARWLERQLRLAGTSPRMN